MHDTSNHNYWNHVNILYSVFLRHYKYEEIM